MTFSLLRSDEPFFSATSVRPSAPCQPSSAVAEGPVFCNVRYPHPTFPGGIHDFHRPFYPGVGRPYGGFQNFGYLDQFGSPVPYQLFGAQGGSLGPLPLGYSTPGPPGFDRYAQYYSSLLHSSQSQTHSRQFERDSGQPIQTQSADSDRVDSKFRDCQSEFPVLGDSRGRHVCDSLQYLPTSVHVSSSGALGTGGRCSVSGLARDSNVHVSADSSAQQGHSEVTGYPGSSSDIDRSLLAITAVVSTPTSALCGSPTVLSIPPISTLSAQPGIHLGRKALPYACMDALMRPRRPSTNLMYDDRWLCFTHRATQEGFDPLNPSAAQIATYLSSLYEGPELHPFYHNGTYM